jgi:hypothetical protein
MTRMAQSGSPSVDRPAAWYRERSTDVWGFGGRRAPIGVRVDGTRVPSGASAVPMATVHEPIPPIRPTELNGNVHVVVDGVASGIRPAGRPPA